MMKIAINLIGSLWEYTEKGEQMLPRPEWAGPSLRLLVSGVGEDRMGHHDILRWKFPPDFLEGTEIDWALWLGKGSQLFFLIRPGF